MTTGSNYDSYRKWAETPIGEPPVTSVIVPAYNEEFRIVPTIGAIATHMSKSGQPWELIVADDGSTDTTVQLVRDLGLVNLRLLEADANGGKGKAVRRGMQAARGQYLLFADADQSTPIEQLDALMAKIHEGNDVVVGSRGAEGAEEASKSLLRHVMSGGLRMIAQLIYRVGVSDTQCGFKLFTRKAALDLFGRQQIDGFSFDLEVLYLARKLDYSVAEVPVEWIDAPGSTVDPVKVALQFLRDLVVIRTNDLRGRYDTTPDLTGTAVPNPA